MIGNDRCKPKTQTQNPKPKPKTPPSMIDANPKPQTQTQNPTQYANPNPHRSMQTPNPNPKPTQMESPDAKVKDITLKFLFQPHTIILMWIGLLSFGYFGFVKYQHIPSTTAKEFETFALNLEGLRIGLWGIGATVIILAVLMMPNGPFTRPHPLVWKVALGVAICYLFFLILMFFQGVDSSRQMLVWFLGYKELGVPLDEVNYAEDCSMTYENVMDKVFDVFFIGHILGWIFKSLMLRDFALCWMSSIAWEFIEKSFIHLLPSFQECWWDSYLLDVLICNGLGIWIGLEICRYLEMREYNWSGIMTIPSLWGKIKRAVLQFTPVSWTVVRWQTTSSPQRYFGVFFVVFLVQLNELNAFLLKSILWIPNEHPLNFIRLTIWFFVACPAIRQMYMFVTNKVDVLGMHAWTTCAILFVETLTIIKLGQGQFPMAKEYIPLHVWKGWVIGIFTFGIVTFYLLFYKKVKRETNFITR